MPEPKYIMTEIDMNGKKVHFPGWLYAEVGHVAECKGHPANVQIVSKCAQYCKVCGVFVGRWMTCGCVEVTCKSCEV